MTDPTKPAPKVTVSVGGRVVGFCTSMSFEREDLEAVLEPVPAELVPPVAEISWTGTAKIDPEALAGLLPKIAEPPSADLLLDGERVGRLVFDRDDHTVGTLYVEPCGLERPSQLQVFAHDTGQGPTHAGLWWAFDGETVAQLRAFELAPEVLAWTWEGLADGEAKTAWTPGWPCAPMLDLEALGAMNERIQAVNAARAEAGAPPLRRPVVHSAAETPAEDLETALELSRWCRGRRGAHVHERADHRSTAERWSMALAGELVVYGSDGHSPYRWLKLHEAGDGHRVEIVGRIGE